MGLKQRVARTRLAVEERRAQLVEKAIEVFSAKPFEEVSLDEVAKDLKISKGLLFHYFPSKREFFAAAIERVADELYAELARPVSSSQEEAMRAGIRAYFGYAKRHKTAYKLLLKHGGLHPSIDEILERTRGRIAKRILEEAAPEVRSRPVARVAVRAWIAFAEATCLELLDQEISQRAAEELIFRTFFQLVRSIEAEAAD